MECTCAEDFFFFFVEIRIKILELPPPDCEKMAYDSCYIFDPITFKLSQNVNVYKSSEIY